MSTTERVLSNPLMTVKVTPDFGGKVTSIVSHRSGREWLWLNPYLPQKTAEYGDSYVAKHDTGGIDECVPTVDACVCPAAAAFWQGTELPDHGEIYHQPWRETGSPSPHSITLEARGIRMPYRFQRRLQLSEDAARLELGYELENLSPESLPFTWCIHPILKIEPGMQILLPAGTSVRTAFASDDAPVVSGCSFTWPVADDRSDISLVPEPADLSFVAKLFASPMQAGQVGLRAGIETFRFTFDTAQISSVAMWLNYGAWSGADSDNYFNAVIEPSIGDADSLTEALDRQTARWLAPGETARWQLTLDIENSEAD